MGKQRLSAGGYDVLTEDPQDAQRTADLRKFRLKLDQEQANKRRDNDLKSHLKRYKDDPIAQALATAEFYAKEEDDQKAREQAEYDSIVSQHSDPVLQGLALAEHYSKKQQAPAAQKAFAESERVDQLLEQEKTARKLENFPLGLGRGAFGRESIGSAVNVVPSLAAPIARVGEAVGLIPEKAADQLYRDSQQFGQAREQAREDDLSPWLSRMYGGASQSLLQMFATPGGAASKIIGTGVMSGSEALTTAEDAGLKGGARLRYALTQGGLEAGIAWLGQKIFGPGIESRIAGQGARATTWLGLAKNIVKDAAKEAPEEGVTSGLQDLSSLLEGVSPDLTFGDFVKNIGESAAQAALMAPMTNAPNAGSLLAKGFTKTPAELRKEAASQTDPATADRTAPPAPTQPERAQEFETPVLKNPAIDAFIAKPESMHAYEAAVRSGMPALKNPNRKERAKYAEEKRQQSQQAPPSTPPTDPTTQATATLEPEAPMEAPPVNVADDYAKQFEEFLLNGEQNDQINQGQQGRQGDQGREGLLTPELMQEAPAGTQDVAMPAESQEVTQPAAHTPEQFEAEYLDTKARFEQTAKGTPEHDALKARMGELFASDPYLADEIEKKSKTPPVVEPGAASPDPLATPLADPVSIPETAIAKTITESVKDVQPEDEDGWRLLKKPIRATVKYENKEPFQVDVRGYNPQTGEVDAWHPTKRSAFGDVKLNDLIDETPVATGVPSPDQSQPVTEAGPVSKPPVPQFAALPQKSQDLFNKAFESRDPELLTNMVRKSNVGWFSEFTNRTGIKIPRNQKDALKAVLDWAGPQATQEPSATEHDRLYKELQPLYRDPKHKAGDRAHMERIRDLEQQVEFHKPAAVARAQAEIDAEAAKKPKAPEKPVVPEPKAEPEAKPQDTPDDADPFVVTRELTDKEIANDPKRGVKPERKIVVVDKQGRTLAITKSKRSSDWSVSERDGRVDKVWASEILTLDKAKDVARRVFRNQFVTDSDLVYRKQPGSALGMTNSELGKDIAKQRNSQKLAGTLVRYGLASNGAVMLRVSDKDRDAILKGIGNDVSPSEFGYPAANDIMHEMQRSLPDLSNAEILGFRGGDYHDATVAVRDAKTKDITVLGKKYFDTARKKFPNAQLKITGDKLILAEGDTVVGIVIGRQEPGDYHHDMLKKNPDAYPWKFDPQMDEQESLQPKVPEAPAQSQPEAPELSQAEMMEQELRDALLGEKPKEPAKPPEKPQPPAAEETTDSVSSAIALVESLHDELLKSRGIDAKRLWELADKAYGGTRAQGKYGPSEAYDALETAINLTILDARAMGMKTPAGQVSPEDALKNLLLMQKQIVSQTNRSGTKDTMQQFSTPPAYSYVVSQFVNMDARDVVLEPSAGTGDLAVHALNQRAKVHVNELDPKRAEMLKAVQESAEDRLTISTEDALQLGNIMGPNLRPSVVLMNPPFSREGQRMGDKKMSGNDRNHIDAAMASLIDGGRLVAIIGAGLHGPSKGFTNWLAETAKKHNVRANIDVSRDVYKGYGTTFPTRVLVIDKGTPTPEGGTVTAQADSLEHLLTMTKGIRNDRNRPTIQPVAPGQNVSGTADKDEGGQQPESSVSAGTATSGSGKPHGNASGRTTKAPRRNPRNADTTAADASGGRPDSANPQGTGINPNAGGKPAGRGTTDAAGEPTGNLAGKSPESGRLDEAKKRSAETAAALKAAIDEAKKQFGKPVARGGFVPVLTREQMRAVAGLVKAGLDHGKSKFNEFVAFVVDEFGPEIAMQMSDGIELAWTTLKRLPEYSGVDDAGKVAEVVESLEKAKEQPPEKPAEKEKRTEIDESVLFEPYQPSIVPFPNAKPHPTAAVESAAMSAVDYPDVTEVPNIDNSIIEDGRLSDVQLEFVALAAHAHNQLLPNEERTGILFGDGTGMGKGRGIPGVILHNWNEGRRQAIWMSKNGKLHSDAMREWEELGGNPAQVANLSDMAVDNPIDLKEGILFATYDTLKSRGKTGKTRESQVTDWLPADFDGVIAFDEAHLMGSDSAARAGVARQLQDKFPKARVVYASATAATEIDQLMFASRLGLWGAATPFATAREFAAKIGSAGVSAMESVALSLKAMGRYVSRSISFNDGTPDGTVGYRRLSHPLADHQVQMYDRLAEAWQKVIGEFEDAMDATGADNFARGFARGQFWSAHQRFFNDLVTSLQMPTVIESIEKDLAEGRSVVIQLTSTGANQQARALAGRGTQSLDDFSVDPFSSLVELVRSQFPTQAYEDYVKDDGSVGKRPVVDSAGKPVKDADAVAAQQQLLSDLAEMESSMPDGPLDMILNYFGIENVAEVTSRSQRVVWQEQPDGTKKRVLEKRSQKKSNQADIDAFQEGKKRILVFSQAGGTGASYHADRRARNQEKRVHYLVQPGWVAADAIQGLGRTHRTNQKQAPEYILVQTDIPGQKRFISTIARRLTQLGALTRGQRTAGGGGVFDAADNLESAEASLALTEFFKSLENEDSVMTIDEFEEQTGLELRLRSTGQMKSDVNLPDITSFMNRMLSMKIASQNKVFDEFDRMLRNITEARRISGELDQGVETIKGGNIRKTRDEVVFTHDSGAKTRYVQLTMDIPVPSRDFESQSKGEKYKDFIGYYKRKSNGRVFFVNESFAKTTNSGRVIDMVRLAPPFGETLREEAHTLGKLEKITRVEAESLWNEQYGNRPKTKPHTVDMVTGAVLPVWDRLPQLQPKLSRALTAAGDMVLGVVLPPSKVNETLGKLGAEKNKVDVDATIKMLRTGKGDVQLVNGWKIERVRVQNEWRLEITGPNPVSEQVFQRQGVIIERIGFRARYFIPFGETTQAVFEAVTRGNPVQKVNRYDSMDSSDDEEVDDDSESVDETEEEHTPPSAPADSQNATDKARQELQELRDEAAEYDKQIKNEIKKLGDGGGAATFLPITPELAKAVAGRMLVSLRIGVKSFEVFIRELRDSADLDESAISGIRDALIGLWNKWGGEFGLDKATPESFDAAMANATDAVLDQAIEAVKSPDPAAMATDPDDEPTIGIKKAKRAERRAELGLEEEELVNKIGHSFPELDADAKMVSPGEAEDVFTRIGEGGEAADNASDRDVFVMLNHYAEKQMATRKTQDELKTARESGDDFKVAELEAKLSVQVAEEVRLMAIAKSAGTAAGRALGAFRAILKYDLSLARLRMRLDAAADGNPTEAQTRELNALHAKYEAVLKELEEKTKEAEAAIARAEIAEQIARDIEARKAPVKTKADRRLEAAWKQFGSVELFSLTGAFQKLPELIEVAGAYIEKGVETFNGFLEEFSNRLGRRPKDETIPVLQQAWDTAWAKEKTPKTSAPPEVSIEPDNPDSLVKAAKALFRYFLSEGITDTEAVIDAVHEELQNQFPDQIGERLDTMKAMVDYDRKRNLSQDPLDILAADKRAVVQMKVHLEQMRRGIAANRIEQRYPVTDEQRAHRKMVAEAKRKGGFVVTDPERQARSALASLETRLRHAISDTLNEIASGTRAVPEKTVGPTSDTTEDLQAYLALIRGMHKAIFGDRTMTQEQKLKAAEAAAVKNEAYWNDRLARAKAGDFSTGKTKPNPVTNAQIDAIKARSELAKAQVAELKALANPKPDPEAISDARYLTSLEKQLAKKLARIADITARAAKGDFAPERNLSKEKREANAQRRKSDASIRDARIKLDETARALNDHIEQVRKKNLTYVDLAKRVPGAVWATLRDAKLTGELSFILRQGGRRVFGVAVPAGKIARAGIEAISGNTDAAKLKLQQAGQGYKQLGRTLARTLMAAFWKTDTQLARSMDALKQRPNYVNGTYEAMRLSLHEDGGKWSVAEELFINNLVELAGLAIDKRFPGFKGFRDGHPVFTKVAHNLNLINRISNATKVFMNEIRADIADDAAALWTMNSGEMTPAEARSLGQAVNAFTGKGDMGLIGMNGVKAMNSLNKVLISAPWLMSRLQVLTGHPLWSKGSTAESRKAAAETYVDLAAGVAAYYGAFILAGMFMADDDDERPVVEWDSTSSDFMKVRIGKTRLDPLFGLQQVIVLVSRILNDEIKDSRGVVRKRKGFEDDWALISRFQEGRLHPAIQDIRSLKTGKDFMGQPITKTEVAIGAITPITYPSIAEASKNRGIPASTALAIWATAGGGLTTYDPRIKAREDVVQELAIVQRKLKNQSTPADLRKSLQADADTMLEGHLVNAVKYEARKDGNTELAELAENHEPGNPISPDLSEAIQKERFDLTLRAVEMLSSEDRRKKKSSGEDKAITDARSILKTIAPTYEEANELFGEAYKQRNGPLTEIVGKVGDKKRVVKESVAKARKRLKAIYAD